MGRLTTLLPRRPSSGMRLDIARLMAVCSMNGGAEMMEGYQKEVGKMRRLSEISNRITLAKMRIR